MPSLIDGTKNLISDRTLDDQFMETFTIQSRTRTTDSMGGFTEVWADGDTFEGRLSVITTSANLHSEQVRNDKIGIVATHKIFTLASVSVDEDDRCYLGSRYFNIVGMQKPSNEDTRPGHYEILVTEID